MKCDDCKDTWNYCKKCLQKEGTVEICKIARIRAVEECIKYMEDKCSDCGTMDGYEAYQAIDAAREFLKAL